MSKLNIKVNGINKFVNNLKNIPDDIIREATQEIGSIVDDVFQESQERVPVQTGALKSSGKIESKVNEDEVIFEISYGDMTPNPKTGFHTEQYALEVHENPNSTGYKFLEVPYLNHLSAYREVIKNTIRRKV